MTKIMTNQVNVNLMKRQRNSKDIGIEGMAARWYDKSTRKHRLPEMKAYANEVTAHVQDGSSVLEVAPGPGYLAIELAKMGRFEIVGLDVSKDFVEIAQRNATKAGVQVEFRQGNAARMPFRDSTFDFVICTAAFKNFKEPLVALREMHRVLKPGSIALIVDMNRSATDEQIKDYTTKMGVRGFEKVFMKLIFKHFLRKGAYTKEEFLDLVSKTAFKEHRIKDEAIGFHAYLVR
ncbi:MAG TPA: class I SAM-dependent methyltransferase [Nitrososphaera sp.]|nr:class I SAM-dependent methyltransferase [Nitrososphaera sp.]